MALALYLLAFSILVALIFGGSPERWGALVLIAMTAIRVLGDILLGARFDAVDPTSLLVDLTGVVSFGAIALFAMRFWPICATALQLLSCATHLVRDLDEQVRPPVYWLMMNAPTMTICLLLLGATLGVQLRRGRPPKPSWRTWNVSAADPSRRPIQRS